MTRDWSLIEYFSKKEWGRDPDKADWPLVLFMDKLRGVLNHPIFIHECWAPDGHTDGSLHYQGKAVDFYTDGDHLTVLLAICSLGPKARIGFYPGRRPWWHVDFGRVIRSRFWTRENGQYIYGFRAMSEAIKKTLEGGNAQ